MFGAHIGAVADDVDASPSTWTGVVNGRSSILFAVLAGVSIALLSGRTVPYTGEALTRVRVRLVIRAAWVFAIGSVLEALGTDFDVILGVYAVLFVLALPFLRWPPRRLFMAAGALAALTPPANLLLTQFAEAHDAADGRVVSLFLTGYYPALIWWTFILVGLAVGRCDLGSPRTRAALGGAGLALTVVGYGVGWLTTQWWGGGQPLGGSDGFSERSDQWDRTWLVGATPHSGTTSEIVGSVGVAFIVITSCLVLAERLPRLTFPLASVGAMALTAYTGSILAIWALDTRQVEGTGLWLTYVAVTVLVATAWRLIFGKGPLERLLAWSASRLAGGLRPRSLQSGSSTSRPDVVRPSGDGAPTHYAERD